MKSSISSLLLASSCLCQFAQAEEEISTHQQYSEKLVSILTRTLASLQLCQDEASVKEQLATLQALQGEMEELSKALYRLPAPSVVDYLFAENLLVEFNRTWQAITHELKRLKAENLLSEELQKVIKVKV